MARGSKSKYTQKQKRQAGHIERGYEKKGVPKKTAEKYAWATVNKESGGGLKGGSGRKKTTRKTTRKSTRKTARKTPRKKTRASSK